MSTTKTGIDAFTVAGQTLTLAQRAGASEAEAWVSAGQTASVRVRGGEVDERVAAETSALTLRVFVDTRTASVTTSDLAPETLDRLVTEAVALARLADPDPSAGLPDDPYERTPDGDALDLVDPALADPDPGLLLDLAFRADAAARGLDPRVRSGEGATATCWAGTQALVNSRGLAASYPATSCSLYVSTAADDEGGKKREGWWFVGDRHLAGMEDAETVGRTAAERTRRQLGARPTPTQEVPVVWAPEAARVFLLEILAEAVSGDARYRGLSFLIGREGERLASPLVTVTDDATVPGRLGSRPFDAEGVASRRTPLIERGVFAGFLYDTYSGRKAGQSSTGNARRGPRIGVGPSNLVMAAGETSPEAIIGGVERGLYLTDMLGFGENITTGDFSRGAAGLWIEGGELAYPVNEINISGRLQEMLFDIDAVGNDARFVESASAPTFRIGRMMVSGR